MDPSSFTSATFRHDRWPSSLEIRWTSPLKKEEEIINVKFYSALSLNCSTHLQVYPVELLVLVLHLRAHVRRHVPQVADHRAHLLHVLFHLLLPVVICDPESQSRLTNMEERIVTGNLQYPIGRKLNHSHRIWYFFSTWL